MKTCVFAVACVLLGPYAVGVEPLELPGEGVEVIRFRDDATQLIGDQAIARGEWVSVKVAPSGAPSGDAFRAEVSQPGEVAWDAQLLIPIERGCEKGDVMLLSFWVRCARSDSESGSGSAAIYVQPGKDQTRFGFRFSAGQAWKHWVRPFQAPADLEPSDANIVIHLSAQSQTIDLADVQLLNYGADFDLQKLPRTIVTYEGRQADAAWREEALQRIDRIRKGELVIEAVDAVGQPISGARVTVKMRRHAFPFGTTVNVMMLAGEERDFPVHRYRKNGPAFRCSWEDAQRYRQIVERYFNRITFEGALRPHVWKLETASKPEAGTHERFRRQYDVLTDKALPWLQSRQISIRGHYLGWGAMDHPPLQRDFVGNPDGHKTWLWEHMADILPNSNAYVSEWDTINHIVGWGKTYDAEYGGQQIHAEIMREARRLSPGLVHAVNEGQILPGGSRRERYENVIRFLGQQGQAPDVVGFMGHFDSYSLTPPEEVLKVYDRFAAISPRLQITELDVDTDGDEQLQADYLRDILTASFSHPKINAVIQWGFWEKQHWKPEAALWRRDWSLKPAGKVFVDLVTRQWWTNATKKSGVDGTCRVRGYHGDYEVTVEYQGAVSTTSATIGRKPSRVQIRVQ